MFPDAFVFNMRFCTIDSIVDEVAEEIIENKRIKTLSELDTALYSKNRSVEFIILNFDFDIREFEGLKAIKLLATIESVDFNFTQDDLLKFRFLLRDLTTFEDYSDDVINSETICNRVQNVKMIFGNLSNKPKIVLLELLKLGNCSFSTLFDSVKSLLLLSKIQSLMDFLREFIDHKVIRVSGDAIKINLSDVERKSLIEILEKDESIHKRRNSVERS